MLVCEGLLELLPHFNEVAHVHLIECCQHGVGVLSLLESLSYSLPHSVHLNLKRKPVNGDNIAIHAYILLSFRSSLLLMAVELTMVMEEEEEVVVVVQ